MSNIILKIKNFIEDCIFDIHNKLFSSRYVLKGKCKKCGNCCRNILFSTQDGYVKSKELFYDMQKKYRYYRNFRISGVVENKQEFQNADCFKCTRAYSAANESAMYYHRNNRVRLLRPSPLICQNSHE